MKKDKLTYNNYKKYFDYSMSNKERNEFERLVMLDGFDQDACDGFQLSEEKFIGDVRQLEERVLQVAHKKRQIVPNWFPYVVAVVVILSLGISSIWYFGTNSKYDLEYVSMQENSLAVTDTVGMYMHKESEADKKLIRTVEKFDEEVLEEVENDDVVIDIPEIVENKVIEKEVAIEADIVDHEVEEVSDDIEIEYEEQPVSSNAVIMKSERNKKLAKSFNLIQPSEASPDYKSIAMPPKGMSLVQFQNRVGEEVAIILEQSDEEVHLLTMVIMIDENGLVSKVDIKEQVKRKTKKDIVKLLKRFGQWKPEIKNGIPQQSELVIVLRY